MTTILPLTWGPQIQRPLRPGGCPMIRTWQRKGSMSCLKHLQVKHFRNLLIPNALFLKCPKRLFIFYKEKFFFFFFLPESQCGPESTVADMVGEGHPVPGVWWTPASPCPWGAEALQARKALSCPVGTEAPGITCKPNLNLPPGCLAQGSILASSVWIPAPSPLPVCKSCTGLTSLPLIPSHESVHSS